MIRIGAIVLMFIISLSAGFAVIGLWANDASPHALGMIAVALPWVGAIVAVLGEKHE